jgi:hypothetical protein
VKFDLHLDERHADRVHVTVCLTPCDAPTVVQGVAIELRSRSGEPLSARLMLPVSGELPGPLALSTELRAREDIPRGARVHGTLWSARGSWEATCPTDPGTTLEAYAYGSAIGLSGGLSRGPEDLDDHERACLYAAYPWMRRYRSPAADDAEQVIEEQAADLVDDIAATYGLSDEDRDLLNELLADDPDSALGGWEDDGWDEGGDELGDASP